MQNDPWPPLTRLPPPSPAGALTGSERRLDEHRLVVVSNRVAMADPGGKSTGGLAVGILAALKRSGGIWFGWSGEVSDVPPDSAEIVRNDEITYATLDLARTDYEQYYNGFANRVLWPLFHFRPGLVDYQRADFAGYLRVNRQFAAHLAPLLRPNDLIWVHDYHLMPLADELRRLGVRLPIGFFLHTPFPSAELFRTLPCHGELMRAMCAYDLVGFQTSGDLAGFRDYLLRWAGATLNGERRPRRLRPPPASRRLSHRHRCRGDRRTGAAIGSRAADAPAAREPARARSHHRRRPARLFEGLAASASRRSSGMLETVPGGARACDIDAGRAADAQRGPGISPDPPHPRDGRRAHQRPFRRIRLDAAALSQQELQPPHAVRASSARRGSGLVTPLRDGMNLVAKEYVAAQDPDDPGALVLSCFAGAAQELTDALLVNPFDIDGVAEAMHEGLAMPREERIARWQCDDGGPAAQRHRSLARELRCGCWAPPTLAR